MVLMVLGLVIFFAVHLFPNFQEQRAKAVAAMGLLPYKAVFSVLALAGFALIIMGKADAALSPIELWQPPHVFRAVTKLLMLPAMVLLVAAYVPSNIKRKVRHPMLIGVKFWALGHLLANGDLASILLFGSFLSYAVFAMISINRRSEPKVLPNKPWYMDLLVLLIGLILYAAIAMLHMSLFGVSIR